MEDYLNEIDEDLWRCVKSDHFRPSMLAEIGNAGSITDVTAQADKKKPNDKRCMCELGGALPPVVYYYVRGCTTGKEI